MVSVNPSSPESWGERSCFLSDASCWCPPPLTSSTGLSGRGVGLTGSYSESSRFTSVTTLSSSWSCSTGRKKTMKNRNGRNIQKLQSKSSVVEPEMYFLAVAGAVKKVAAPAPAPAQGPALTCVYRKEKDKILKKLSDPFRTREQSKALVRYRTFL